MVSKLEGIFIMVSTYCSTDTFLIVTCLNDIFFQVLLEQLTSSPWNNMFFLIYYGLVVEGKSLHPIPTH